MKRPLAFSIAAWLPAALLFAMLLMSAHDLWLLNTGRINELGVPWGIEGHPDVASPEAFQAAQIKADIVIALLLVGFVIAWVRGSKIAVGSLYALMGAIWLWFALPNL